MSEPVPVIVDIRRIKNLKVSTLHAKAERYRDGFVKLFREHEHAYLLNEDGSEMLDGAGRRVSLTAGRFAREMGIPKQTFHEWLSPPDRRVKVKYRSKSCTKELHADCNGKAIPPESGSVPYPVTCACPCHGEISPDTGPIGDERGWDIDLPQAFVV